MKAKDTVKEAKGEHNAISYLEGYQQGRANGIKEVVELLKEHEGCDKWGNPCITIGYNDKGNKVYAEWWQAKLKEWGVD